MEILGLEWWQAALIILAGFWAGTINAVVGSGTLVTFPTLVSIGFPPVTAQMSNAVGLVAAGFSGTFGYRRELRQSRQVLPILTVASLLGGIIGALLLMVLPEEVFGYAAPVLILVAVLIVVFQPRLQAWVRRRKADPDVGVPGADPAVATGAVQPDRPVRPISPALWLLVFGTGIYGGYFTAAQGVLLMGIFGVFLAGTLAQANAVKTWLSLAVNLIAAISYVVFSFDRIAWNAVLLIAASSLVGGSLGAAIGRRVRPAVLRTIIVVVGVAGFVNMVLRLINQ